MDGEVVKSLRFFYGDKQSDDPWKGSNIWTLLYLYDSYNIVEAFISANLAVNLICPKIEVEFIYLYFWQNLRGDSRAPFIDNKPGKTVDVSIR